MAFFDKVKDLALSAAQTTSDKIEVAKVSKDIRNEENKVREVLASIGKIIYGKYEAGIVKDEEVIALCKEVDDHMENIQVMREKALELKDKKSCVNCGKELNEEDMYCAACGSQQPSKADPEDEANAEDTDAAETDAAETDTVETQE